MAKSFLNLIKSLVVMTFRSSKSSRIIAYHVKNNFFLSGFSFIAIPPQTVRTGASKLLFFPFLFISLYVFVILFLTYLFFKGGSYDLSNISSYRSGFRFLLKVCEGFLLVLIWHCHVWDKMNKQYSILFQAASYTYIKARCYLLIIICSSLPPHPLLGSLLNCWRFSLF